MRVETKAKLLQYLLQTNNTEGFSLYSLLVRTFIYGGVLVTLILPFYNYKCNCLPKWWSQAPQPQAQQNIGAINRAQQAYFLENNKFSNSLAKLGIGIVAETENYSYRILAPMEPVQSLDKANKKANSKSVIAIAQAKDSHYSSYLGVVYTYPVKTATYSDTMTSAEVCKIESEAPLPSTLPTFANRIIECPSGSTSLSLR